MTYDWLTGARRVAMAVSGRPDCVPIYGPLPDHAMYLTNLPSQTFYTVPELFAESQLLLAEYYGFDLPYVQGDVHNIEAEALGRRLLFRDRAAPMLDPAQLLIHSPADLDRLQTPDFATAGRLPFTLETYRLIGDRTGLPASRWFCAPFSLACEVMGYPQLVGETRRNPGFVHALLAALFERVLVPWIRCSLQHHPAARAATGIDHWASFPVITWPMFREYVIPYARQLRDLFAREGYQVVVQGGWGDGRLPDPLPLFAERIRLQGALRGLDPDVCQLGPELYAQVAARHGVALGLGIDSGLIHDGPVQAIVDRIRTYIQKAGANGRLTLILNNVPGDTPPEHIHAAVAAAHSQYPVGEDLLRLPFALPESEPFAEFARRRGWKLPQPVWESAMPFSGDALKQAIVDGDVDLAVAETTRGLKAGMSPQALFEGPIVAGVQEAGRLWEANEYFVPDVILSADAFKAAVKVAEQHLQVPLAGNRKKVVIGVVKGDIHDLGKSIVIAMLQGAGFIVVDLGVDVPPERFVEAVAAEGPDILGIGAYLSTTLTEIRDVMHALKVAGLRSRVRVMVGGVPTTQRFADSIQADAWGKDASSAVRQALRLISMVGGEGEVH